MPCRATRSAPGTEKTNTPVLAAANTGSDHHPIRSVVAPLVFVQSARRKRQNSKVIKIILGKSRDRQSLVTLKAKKAGRSGGGSSGLLAKSSGEEGKLEARRLSRAEILSEAKDLLRSPFARPYMDDGLPWPAPGAEAGCALSPTVFVIRRTSTRRLSARPVDVLFDSTGLSLPSPIT
jgi:hypothetical protein